MFCYVKYVCDGEKAIVPDTFVKDFEENFSKDKYYKVFWSPFPDDTPTKLLNKQKKILTIDTQKELKQKENSAPLPGYYFANILMIAETEKELEAILDSKCGRRDQKKIEKDTSQKKQKDKKTSEIIKLGKKRSTEMLKSVFSDSDSDDSVIPIKIHKEEILEFKKENKILKSRNINLKMENEKLKVKFEEIYSLNIQLQKKLLNPNLSFKPQFDAPLSLSENTPVVASPSIQIPEEVLISPKKNQIEVENIVNLKEVTDAEGEEQFRLEDTHLAKAVFRVKSGQAGDSLFVKNLASAVFNDEVLAKSSVTGTKCHAKKNAEAKPALCAKRLAYIKKLFHERMHTETPVPTMEERKKRLNKFNSYVAEKIVTLNRKNL